MTREKKWSYKNLDIDEGLKPGSKHFQYFFVVSEKGKKSAITVYGSIMKT